MKPNYSMQSNAIDKPTTFSYRQICKLVDALESKVLANLEYCKNPDSFAMLGICTAMSDCKTFLSIWRNHAYKAYLYAIVCRYTNLTIVSPTGTESLCILGKTDKARCQRLLDIMQQWRNIYILKTTTITKTRYGRTHY